MARAKRWKPMVRTEGDVQKAVAKIGDLPKEVIALYVARETKGDECIKACEAILKRDPEHCAALIYMGTILAERRRYIKALRFLDRAVEISALMYPAWQWKGMCETYLKRPRAARFSLCL